MTAPDPWDDPENQRWARRVRDDLVPKIRGSAATISMFASATPDVKFAVELGMSMLLDKPIILLVTPGVQVPDHVVRAADLIIEGNPGDPHVAQRIAHAVNNIAEGRMP